MPIALVKDILDRALALQQDLDKSGQTAPVLQRSQGVALDESSDTLLSVGDTAGALVTAQHAQQIWDTLFGHESQQYRLAPRTVSQLRQDLYALKVHGKSADALAAYQKMLAIRQKLADGAPDNPMRQSDLAIAYDRSGSILFAMSDYAQALDYDRKGLAIHQKLAAPRRTTPPGSAAWASPIRR